MNSRRLGAVVQTAYVVKDIHDAIRHWSSNLGVGPFYLLERLKYPEGEVDGTSGCPEISLAFAYSGDLQIELMQQHDDEPSVIHSYPPSPINGLHHIGILSDDFRADEARLIANGLRPVGSLVSELGVRAGFFHGGPQCGGLVELVEINELVTGFFDALKRASTEWDGVTPYGTPPG